MHGPDPEMRRWLINRSWAGSLSRSARVWGGDKATDHVGRILLSNLAPVVHQESGLCNDAAGLLVFQTQQT